MNTKKQGKFKIKGTGLTTKALRAGHSSKMGEARSRIAAKRVSLLPGFLRNGFSSGTVRKPKINPLLTENLYAILERKQPTRRSQRIARGSHSFDSTASPLPTVVSAVSSKPILRKNSKSIFKEINEKFAGVHIQTEQQLIEADHSQQKGVSQQQQEQPPPEFSLIYNRNFCEEITKKIRVTFKKDPIKESQENIKKEIAIVNAILEGKMKREDSISSEQDEMGSENQDKDFVMYPVPQKCWTYHTPPNQNINPPPPKECQLQPAIVYRNVKKSPTCSGPTRIKRNGTRMELFFDRPPDDHLNCCKMQQKTHMCSNSFDEQPQDFTFIQDGAEFKIRESQVRAQPFKRQLSDEGNFTAAKKGNFQCDDGKMFDFSSQERNIFDFGNIV